MSWNVISVFVLDQLFGYQTANKIRENLITNIAARRNYSLGGSRANPNFAVFDPALLRIRSKYPSLGPFNAEDWLDVEIDATELTNLTVQARVEVRTNDPAMSITPKIINASDATDIVVGSACVAGNVDYTGTNQKQTLAMPLTAGIKKYRLQYTLGANMAVDSWCTGQIEIFATV